MCSSQPRVTPSFSFSSGQIQFWTTPAISSPSHATTHRSVSRSLLRNRFRKSSSVISRDCQWSRNASASASKMARCWSGVTGRTSTPSGRGASGMSSRVGRRIMKNQRNGVKPAPSSRAMCPTSVSSTKPRGSNGRPSGSCSPRSAARRRFSRRSTDPSPRRRWAGWTWPEMWNTATPSRTVRSTAASATISPSTSARTTSSAKTQRGRVLEVLADLRRGRDPRHAILGVGRADQPGHRLEVGVVAARPSEPEPVDRRGIGEFEPGRRVGRRIGRHGVISVVEPSPVDGTGLVQSMEVLAISKPSERYSFSA